MKRQILIFGAGNYGKHAFLYYSTIYNIIGFIDNNSKFIGKNIFGVPIFLPDVLKSQVYKNIPIIVANRTHYKDIQEQLYNDYGISEVILFQIKVDERFLRFEDRFKVNRNLNQSFIVEYKGGLGNQMFQYAFHRWLEKRGFIVQTDLSAYHLLRSRPFLLNKIFKRVRFEECNYLHLERLKEENKISYENEDKRFNLQQSSNIILSGYWQHFFYSDEIKNELRELYSFDIQQEKELINMAERLSKENSVSVHIRCGDYLQKENVLLFGGICTYEYYQSAIQYIKDRVKCPRFYVFCNDINWVEEHMKMENIIYIDKNKFENYVDWYDMFLMTQCKHNIIANSSFSWWGAWLNQNSSKIVIAPKKWRNDRSLKNICPQKWIRL